MSALQELRQREQERAETLAQVSALDVTRHLIRSGAYPLERARARTLLAEELLRQADHDAEQAREEGASYAEIADALHLSRQGARKRYGHLEAVS